MTLGPGAGTAAAWLLAGVFTWAGAAKLARPRRTAAGFASLRLRAPGFLALAVPLCELALAVTLLLRPAAGGVAALVTLGIFTAVLVRNLRGQSSAGCGCFGSGAYHAVSGVDVLRNGFLALLAAASLGARDPAGPVLPEVVGVSTALAAGLVLLALAALRRDAGAVWDNTVPRGPEDNGIGGGGSP